MSLPHIAWLTLVLVNLVIQLLYYYNDNSRTLYLGKKITTPLLLLGGLALVLAAPQPYAWDTAVILALMGLGELGIEGSSVVQERKLSSTAKKIETIQVTAAGIIFLAVNIFLGILLAWGKPYHWITLSLLLSGVIYIPAVYILFRVFKPGSETRFQVRTYSISLIVLLAGTLVDMANGFSQLGLAGLLLTVSDTLVLVRMGMSMDKKSGKGFTTLLVFLAAILILYYTYMAVLVNRSNPFIAA